MTLLVVDASAFVEYLLRTDTGLAFAPVIEADDALLHTPALCDVEVVAALRRALLLGELDEARAVEALESYLELPLARHGHAGLAVRLLQLRHNFSAYDATYVAVCELLDAELLTADGGLARAVAEIMPGLRLAEP
jgi:predicted nucleic acid-binding protein